MSTSGGQRGWVACGRLGGSVIAAALLAGCASTTVSIAPPAPAPVCDRNAAALVLWAPKWRADQKDVAARESAAAEGIGNFFDTSRCFARTEVRRVDSVGAGGAATPGAAASAPTSGAPASDALDTVVTLEVRELGPVLRLLSSAALVEGGTEVVVQVSARPSQAGAAAREFIVHWRHGGPGVIKGVGSLARDMAAALQSALQPAGIAP